MTLFYQKEKRRRGEKRLIHVFTMYFSWGTVESACGRHFRYGEIKMLQRLPLINYRWCERCREEAVSELVALKLGEMEKEKR